MSSGEARESSREIRIGVSSCLLGRPVRFDGGSKKNSYLLDTVAEHIDFVPVCPEVEVGLGTPRETIRLERSADGPRLVAPKSGRDLTESMRSYSEKRVEQLKKMNLSGFVLKAGSPSCGMERVRVYDHNGVPSRNGRGVFAQVLADETPLLPLEEEGRLNDDRLRESFFTKVFAHHRLEQFFGSDWTPADLTRVHAREKLLLRLHDVRKMKELGRLVASAHSMNREDVETSYREMFMTTLAKPARRCEHGNILHRVMGFFRSTLPRADRHEAFQLIADFRRGIVPIVVPLTLIRHYIRQQRVAYLAAQSYFDPHPKDLMLRNFV